MATLLPPGNAVKALTVKTKGFFISQDLDSSQALQYSNQLSPICLGADAADENFSKLIFNSKNRALACEAKVVGSNPSWHTGRNSDSIQSCPKACGAKINNGQKRAKYVTWQCGQ